MAIISDSRHDHFKLTITLTYKCNLKCSYCYVSPESNRTISKKSIEAGIELAATKIKPGGTLFLGFFGGEPLLEQETIWWSINKAKEITAAEDITVSPFLTTNGTLVDSRFIKKCAEHNLDLTFSIDGTKHSHNRHRKTGEGNPTYETVTKALDDSIRVLVPSVNVVIHPDTVHELHTGFLELSRKNLNRIILSLDYSANWSKQTLNILSREFQKIAGTYAELKKSGATVTVPLIDNKIQALLAGGLPEDSRCSIAKKELTLLPDGSFTACERLARDSANGTCRSEDLLIGTTKQGLTENIIDGLISRFNDEPPGCQECEIADYCKHDCFCINIERTGLKGYPDGLICTTERIFLQTAGRVMNLL